MASVDTLAAEIEDLEVSKGGSAERGEMSAAAKKRAKKKAAAKNKEMSPKDEPIVPKKEATDASDAPVESMAGKLTAAELKKIALSRAKKKGKKSAAGAAQAAMAAEKAKAPKPVRHADYEATWDPNNCELGGGLVHDD